LEITKENEMMKKTNIKQKETQTKETTNKGKEKVI